MSRLPIPGQDSGTWGDILNDYLSQAHAADGTLKSGSVGAAQLQTNAVADATTSAKGVIQLTGDLTGTAASPQIAKIQGIALSGTPTAGQVLTATSGTAASWSSLAAPTYPSGGSASTVQRPTVVDIRDHITSGTTFDMQAVVAAMEQGGGYCYVPPGDWTANACNIALNETAVTGGGSAQSRFTYVFRGAGKQSKIILPAGMTNTDFLWIANSTNANNFYDHWKVVIEDIAFSGGLAPNGSVIKLNQRSLAMRRVWLGSLLNGAVSTGYADLTNVTQVVTSNQTAGGWVYLGTNLGDGYVFDQIMAYGAAAVKVSGSLGATVRNCVSGYFDFTGCDVVFDANHLEGDGYIGSTPLITLRGCTAQIRSGYYEAKKYRPTFSIDDANDTLYSRIVFGRNVRFTQRLDDPSSAYGAVRAVDVDIQSLSKQSELIFESNKSFVYGSSTANPGYQPGTILALNVTATGAAASAVALSTILSQSPLRVGTDYIYKYIDGSWQGWPTGDRPIVTRAFAQPFVSASAFSLSAGGYSTSISSGTYYYKIWGRDLVARLTASSAEASVTVDGTTTMPKLTINAENYPAQIRILRGTSSGVYTQYTQVNAADAVQTLFDQGSHIGGTAWTAWSGSPAVPSTGISQTRNGVVYSENGRSEFRSPLMPTDGTWLAGDFCWNTAASGVLGWLCTVGGSPGTWIAVAGAPTISTITTATTLGAAGNYVTFIGSGGVLTLPTAVGNTSVYDIKNIDTGAQTILTTSSQTIDGSTTVTLQPNMAIKVVSDGANWRIF